MNALALDVDGTLVDSRGILVPIVRDALSRAWPKTIIVLASGRPPSGVRHIQSQLGVEGPFVALNGAVVVDGNGITKSLSRSLSSQVMASVQELCTLFKSDIEAIFAYSSNHWVAHGKIDTIQNEALLTGSVPEDDVDEGTLFSLLAIKLTVVCKDESTCIRFCDRMRSHLGRLCQTEQSKRDYVEITRQGVSKGRGLKELTRTNRWTHVVSVGDGTNDISMFKASSVSYAMPWAADTVKKSATHVIARPGYSNLAKVILASVKTDRTK